MTILGRFLKGSQNYCLNGPDSDEDWVVVYCRDFEELYIGKTYNNLSNEHESYWDLRDFVNRLCAMDPTVLECVFSTKQEYMNEDFKALMGVIRLNCSHGTWIPQDWASFINKMVGFIRSDMKKAINFKNEYSGRKALSRAFYFLGIAHYVCNNHGCLDVDAYRDTNQLYNLAHTLKFMPEMTSTFDEQIEKLEGSLAYLCSSYQGVKPMYTSVDTVKKYALYIAKKENNKYEVEA